MTTEVLEAEPQVALTQEAINLPEEDQKRIEVAEEVLGNKYGPIIPLGAGAQKIYAVSEWGLGKTKRGILVDRATESTSPRAQRNHARGYGLKTEVQTLAKIPDARKNHIAGLIDYHELADGEKFTISVVDHIEGEQLSDRILKRKKKDGKPIPLTREEVKTVFSNILQAAKHYTSYGKFHRDVTEQNIMLSQESGGLEGILVDFGIACDKEKIEPKALPTSGFHLSMDPLLFPQFTRKAKKYGIDSEIFQIADTLYFSGTGKHIVEYDPDNRIAISLDNGQSLLDEQGIVIPEKHEEAISRATKALPKELRRYSELIQKAMTLDESARYTSIDQFIEDFNAASQPTKLEKIASNWKPLATAALVCVIGLTALTYGALTKKESLEKTIAQVEEDAGKITLAVDHNGKELVIDNNIIELQGPQVYINRGTNYQDCVSYPKREKIINAKQGETLDIYVPLKEKPWKSATKLWSGLSLPSFRGRVYIEGCDPVEFYSSPESFNEAYTRDMGGPMAGNPKCKIPSDLPDGVHNLIVEIDAPRITTDPSVGDASKGLKVQNKDQIINRRVIPIVVGNVKEKIQLGSANIEGYTHGANFFELGKDYDGTMPSKLTYESAILSERYHENQHPDRDYPSNAELVRFNLPKSTNTQTTALGILVRNKEGKPVYSVCVPIKSEDIMNHDKVPNAAPMYWYRLGTPGTNFWKEVKAQKAALYSEKAKEAQVKR